MSETSFNYIHIECLDKIDGGSNSERPSRNIDFFACLFFFIFNKRITFDARLRVCFEVETNRKNSHYIL